MRILVVGVLCGEVSAAIAIAQGHGATVTHAPDTGCAVATLRSGKGAELVLIDVKQNIRGFIEAVSSERINVTIAAYGIDVTAEEAANAIKAGAKEYLPLPPDKDLIAAILEAAAEETSDMICESGAMQQCISFADKIAGSDASVLITGESGTGKEVIARYIHKKSKRSKAAFISVNCAAIPDNLLESEMFGHEKGAFTGATHRRIGKFEEADGGTLLLDEISEMDFRLQAKLLRAVQERVIDRVGGKSPVKVDIRILATSNRNLQEEIKEGRFREDLFFRLNVINIDLPPLRNRIQDVEAFASHFIEIYSEANGLPVLSLAKEALQKLKQHKWPGNVREFENVIHRAVLMSVGQNVIGEGEVMLSASHAASQQEEGNIAPGNSVQVGRSMDSVEKEHILGTLDHCLGNRTHAAKILGISIRTLRNKLNQYQLENPVNDTDASSGTG